jgi:SSS family solute:Na+ symporter
LSEKVTWLAAFAVAYWAYCIYWGVVSGRMADSASDYFLADRRLPPWLFVLGATVISFTGWTFLGNPAVIFRDGFQFAEVSLCATVIPLAGVMFLKRQWLIGKRFGFVTPGEMFANYFQSEPMRLLLLLVALIFSVPFIGMQLRASGALFGLFSDGAIDRDLAMWLFTAVVFLYVCLGGLRAVVYVASLQALLFAAGIAALGLFAYAKLGGFGAFSGALAKLGATDIGTWGRNADGYNAYLEIPGVIQFTRGLGNDTPVGGIWTATLIMTYSFGLMGIQATPVFTMWAFGSRSPNGFAPQQVWASAAAVGVILIFFSVAQGLGALFLGASPAVTGTGLDLSHLLSPLGPGLQQNLVGHYIYALATSAPWFGALLAMCALAGVQAITAAYANAAATMLSRDLYQRYLNPTADDRLQKFYGRLAVGLIMLAALLVATYAPAAQSALGALALGFGFQLWPALAALCWFPWLTRQGILLGLIAGLVAVIFTEPFGIMLAAFFGIDVPWGRWPWTIHSAGWGIAANVVVCVIVSALTQRQHERRHRMTYHSFLAEYAAMTPEKRSLRPVAWSLTLIWIFFAIGPGAVIGNNIFGAPNGGLSVWKLGVPSLWAWQVLWWALGVLMIWFLAYKMELSTVPARNLQIQPLPPPPVAAQPLGANWQPWFWTIVGAMAVVVLLHWMFG